MYELERRDICECEHERGQHGNGHNHCHICKECKRFMLLRRAVRP